MDNKFRNQLTHSGFCVTICPLPELWQGKEYNMKKWILLVLVGAILLTGAACHKEEEIMETTSAPETEGDVVIYYHGDKHGSRLVEETTLVPRLTAQALVDLLAEQKVIPQGTRVRNFKLKQGIITLDLSKEFEEGAQGLGSSGENVLLGSLVNTFLATYEAKGLDLTTEGRSLVTGHDVYDYTLEFYS